MLPSFSIEWLRIGKRVWFSILPGPAVQLSIRPRGPRGPKRWSLRAHRTALCRVQRGVRTRHPWGTKVSTICAQRSSDPCAHTGDSASPTSSEES